MLIIGPYISIIKKLLITLCLLLSLLLLIFSGYPNPTRPGSIGFEITFENALLYCFLPFVGALTIITILVLICIKTQNNLIYASINLGVCSLIMDAYTILLSIITSDWLAVGLTFNLLGTVILLSLAIVLLFLKKKYTKK